MNEVKWIKIVTDIFDDEKMLLIDGMPERDCIIVIWFKLLCLAGKQNNCGLLTLADKIAYTDEMLSQVFRRPLNTIRLALDTFRQFGMIEIIDGTIAISNWEKHQNLDAMEKIREQNRQRVAKHRNKQRVIQNSTPEIGESDKCNVTVTLPVTLRNATDKDIDIDIDNIKKEIYKERKPTKRFKKPTIEELQAYCSERKNSIDAERFFDYYESKGWLVGKNPMKDWKAAVRNWERNSYGKNNGQSKQDDVDTSWVSSEVL